MANDKTVKYDSIVVEKVLNNFYVDDCLTTVATKQEAVKLASDLRKLLVRGGFQITKRLSNDK